MHRDEVHRYTEQHDMFSSITRVDTYLALQKPTSAG